MNRSERLKIQKICEAIFMFSEKINVEHKSDIIIWVEYHLWRSVSPEYSEIGGN